MFSGRAAADYQPKKAGATSADARCARSSVGSGRLLRSGSPRRTAHRLSVIRVAPPSSPADRSSDQSSEEPPPTRRRRPLLGERVRRSPSRVGATGRRSPSPRRFWRVRLGVGTSWLVRRPAPANASIRFRIVWESSTRHRCWTWSTKDDGSRPPPTPMSTTSTISPSFPSHTERSMSAVLACPRSAIAAEVDLELVDVVRRTFSPASGASSCSTSGRRRAPVQGARCHLVRWFGSGGVFLRAASVHAVGVHADDDRFCRRVSRTSPEPLLVGERSASSDRSSAGNRPTGTLGPRTAVALLVDAGVVSLPRWWSDRRCTCSSRMSSPAVSNGVDVLSMSRSRIHSVP